MMSAEEARKMLMENIENGKGVEKLKDFIKAQGGDINSIKVCDSVVEVLADRSGTLKEINALELGKLSVKLGAGRVNKEDKINHGVGIYLEKLVGDSVKKDDVLARIFVDKIPDKLKISNIFVIN